MSKLFYVAVVLFLFVCIAGIESAPNLVDDNDVVDDDNGEEATTLLVRHKRWTCNRLTGDMVCGWNCRCGGACRNGICTCYRPLPNGRCPRS
ncbi:unnamed protein product [Rotaria sp. Silwood1]|nr:unnamed protein product [Rotaria sp. Silwood1]